MVVARNMNCGSCVSIENHVLRKAPNAGLGPARWPGRSEQTVRGMRFLVGASSDAKRARLLVQFEDGLQ